MADMPESLFDNDEGLTYQDYFDALPGIVSVQDRDFNILQTNSRLREFFGDHTGQRCYELFKRRTEKCKDCPVWREFVEQQKLLMKLWDVLKNVNDDIIEELNEYFEKGFK